MCVCVGGGEWNQSQLPTAYTHLPHGPNGGVVQQRVLVKGEVTGGSECGCIVGVQHSQGHVGVQQQQGRAGVGGAFIPHLQCEIVRIDVLEVEVEDGKDLASDGLQGEQRSPGPVAVADGKVQGDCGRERVRTVRHKEAAGGGGGGHGPRTRQEGIQTDDSARKTGGW